MGLDLIGKYIAGALVSVFGADGSNKHYSFPHSRSDTRTTSPYVIVAGQNFISVSYIATESELASEMNGCDARWM